MALTGLRTNLAPPPFIVLLRNSSPLPSGCQTLLCCGFRFRLSLCTSGFVLLPEMCRPAADTEVSCCTKKKTLLPWHYSPKTSADQATFLSPHLNNRSNFWFHFWKWLELNWLNSSNHGHVFKRVSYVRLIIIGTRGSFQSSIVLTLVLKLSEISSSEAKRASINCFHSRDQQLCKFRVIIPFWKTAHLPVP